ncbi:MAG: marine proteobacterial sortase target protein [Pseudomonadales bacterium]|nr:marine proteobacterial sortase target protein [Pseudomonadales bacterium]MBO6597880.1 marine proteobacterial sortase target protein [Pseudomonadales bacterium]MBO6824288.1 marine proteobacterial sortase target protein [Pseudomonadales bacterium]
MQIPLIRHERPLVGLASLLCLVILFLWGGSPRPVSAAIPNTDDIGAGQILFELSDGQTINALHMESSVSFSISGVVTHVELTQRFRNQTEDYQEAVYVLPMPDTAAINEMEMHVGERLIKAEIKERQVARKIYEQAKTEGKKAALVEQNRPNLYRQSVANIAPGETIVIRLKFVDSVQYDSGEFSYRFPMTLTPRYMPGEPLPTVMKVNESGWSLPTTKVSDANLITPPMIKSDDGLVNPIDIHVNLAPGLELQEIGSPYHEISVNRAGEHYEVSLAHGRVTMDRDFVLRWRPVYGSEPQAAIFTESVAGETYALMMLLPPEGEEVQALPRDMIFVIDTSGSMRGSSIEQARSSLLKALSRLRPHDRFNVIEFNSSWSRLFSSVQSPDAYHLERARTWVSQLGAGGGTNMLPALEQALADGDEESQLKQIVFITDGAVGNEQGLFQLIRERLGKTRLFPVGIGSAPNSYFMRQAAKHGRGSYTYIGSLIDVADQMEALFKKIDSPVASDFSVTWPVQSESYPEKIPALYKGEPLLLVAKVSDLKGEVIVRGRTSNAEWSSALDLSVNRDHIGVGTLWAREKIEHLTDLEIEGRDSEATRGDIIEVALAHKLVTKHTSLVAVEEIVSREPEAELKSSAVPNAVAKGQVLQPMASYPSTATPASLLFLVGCLSLLLAGVTRLMPAR